MQSGQAVRGGVIRTARFGYLVCWLGIATACAGEDGGSGPSADPACVPHETLICYCENGNASMQRCSADGTTYLPCECALGAGGMSTGGAAVGGSLGGGGVSSGGSFMAAGGQAGASSDGGMPLGGGGSQASGDGGASALAAPQGFEAIAGSTTVGLEWDRVEGATGYRIYWSETPGVRPGTATGSAEAEPGWIHEGLTDGTTYHYVVVALDAGGQTEPSGEVSATPGGEFVLEQLGVGIVPDFRSTATFDVPIVERVHVVIAAEGYQQADLAQFEVDVDGWRDDVFSVNPFDTLREALVIWKLPRPSVEHIPGANTAFRVPTVSGGSGVGSISDEVAERFWAAMGGFPVPLQSGSLADTFGSTTLNVVASFLLFDADRGRAGLSGRATTLQNPAGDGRVWAAFARGHVHEFGHAFGRLSDEYLEYDLMRNSTTETSNVVATNQCSELPWQHLLAGGAINPDVTELVGAFGRDGLGYHPELWCLMNGTHDNADFYGGNGTLRSDDRLCNYCRELTAFRGYERVGLLVGFDAWKADFRAAFFQSEGFAVPEAVPQDNGAGQTFFEACVP